MTKEWYIVNVISGREHKVVGAMKSQIAKKELGDRIFDIVVPVENIKQLKRGKKVVVDKKMFPGYIMINMILDNITWNLIKNIPNVMGFLGSGNNPLPMTNAEVKRVLQQVEDGAVAKEVSVMFNISEAVKIIEGPFESFTGHVDEIDADKKKLKISVSIFGRSTPVMLSFAQVEKLD